ncbi:unnamed protein product [Symbiodinium necroappetens]|uniref:Uncharacterized protein n=1 Tax=Symbiodinium necroappetens TaxID=1628268 RepID=A0A813CI28_9DINO|nr:unnamed protein product [Symbiodinium necroappetens]
MSTAAWDVGNLQIVLWDEEAVQYKAEDVALPLPAPPPPGYGPHAEAREALLNDCRSLLYFLWLHHSRCLDRRPRDIMALAGAGDSDINFDLWFAWENAQAVTHTVNGGDWNDITSTWLRLELQGTSSSGAAGSSARIVSYHGTRWPKLPWILQEKGLRAGPRVAGNTRGVWSSQSFQVAEMYAWPEPLAGAAQKPWNPWKQPEASTRPGERFQVVLELELQEWRCHSRSKSGYLVTQDEAKVTLKALHLRCWREGSSDHPSLRQGYFPSSFMPNGERLDFVPGGSLDGQAKRQTLTKWIRPQLQRVVRKAESNKKRVKKMVQKKVPKRVTLNYADVDITELCWDSLVAVVQGRTLREKLDKIMRKAYVTVVKCAASPVALLSGWATEVAGQLVQEEEFTFAFHRSVASDIIEVLKRMLQGGALPRRMVGQKTWDKALEDQLQDIVAAKLSRVLAADMLMLPG